MINLTGINYGKLFQWSLFHVLHNLAFIQENCFNITLFNTNLDTWVAYKHRLPEYQSIGEVDYQGSVDRATLNALEPSSSEIKGQGTVALYDIADVIRSKNAGVDTICFDIFFRSKQDYRLAIASNVFIKSTMQEYLGVSKDQMINSFYYEKANAIKVSVYRTKPSGRLSERDVFGA